MSIEYLLVVFDGDNPRSVLADGKMVGVTNHTLMLPADEYEITLDGVGYTPTSQDVVLSGTTLVNAEVVTFTSTAAAAKGGTNA